MTTSLLFEVMQYILGFPEIGLNSEQIFIATEPDSAADPSVTLYDRVTEELVQTHDEVRPAIETVRFQLTCRSREYSEAETLAFRLHDAFWNHTANAPFEFIWPMGLPTALGDPDTNARWPVGFGLRASRVGGD